MTDETMEYNAQELANTILGDRIVSVTAATKYSTEITLASGRVVELIDSYDCCAYTELEKFMLRPDAIDHVITGVRVEDDYQTWHIYADMGDVLYDESVDVLDLEVAWGEGSGYYGYGFDINVKETN